MRNSRRPSDRTLRNGEYMQISLNFILESIIFGVGLAMDAFSVSMANGLQDPGMSRKRMLGIAGTFAFFQFLMPMIGWACVHTIAKRFEAFQKMVPWIAFVLLVFIGSLMGNCSYRALRLRSMLFPSVLRSHPTVPQLQLQPRA